MATRVGIALGANLGARLANLREARDVLRDLGGFDSLCHQAPLYMSAPVDCAEDAPDFLNTVIEIDFSGSPMELLQITQGIELRLGRAVDHGYNTPRVIDIDILYFGAIESSEPILTLPHPRMLDRRFVLQPLNDIRPDLVLPRDAATISEHYRHLESDEPELVLIQEAW